MKRVLVTGGARGLGLAICQKLLAEGHRVVTTSRKASAEISALLKQNSDRFEYYPMDLTGPDSVRELAKSARLNDGLDGLVSNAAIGTAGMLTLTSERLVRECIEVNLIAPMLLAREVIKGMLDRGGSIIFISSVAARTGLKGLTFYGAAKGGLVSFSRGLAREYGPRGIRSNCILPGFLKTDMTESLDVQDRDRLTRRTALKRLGLVEDVTGTVSFLLSDDARYITGTEIIVDGGMLA